MSSDPRLNSEQSRQAFYSLTVWPWTRLPGEMIRHPSREPDGCVATVEDVPLGIDPESVMDVPTSGA